MAELIKYDFVFRVIGAKSFYNKFMEGPSNIKADKKKDMVDCFYKINDILLERNASEDTRLHMPNARLFAILQIMKAEDGSKGNVGIAMFIDDNYINNYSIKLKVISIIPYGIIHGIHSIYLCDARELMMIDAI